MGGQNAMSCVFRWHWRSLLCPVDLEVSVRIMLNFEAFILINAHWRTAVNWWISTANCSPVSRGMPHGSSTGNWRTSTANWRTKSLPWVLDLISPIILVYLLDACAKLWPGINEEFYDTFAFFSWLMSVLWSIGTCICTLWQLHTPGFTQHCWHFSPSTMVECYLGVNLVQHVNAFWWKTTENVS